MSRRVDVILVTGPAGAGKTAAAGAWARAQRTPAIQISLDDVRDLVKSGYANPEDGWTPEAQRQHALARAACARIAALYAANDFRCAIDDAVFPDWSTATYDGWKRDLGDLSHAVVVLLPSFEALVERNSPRAGHRRLGLDTLRTIYELMLPWRDQDVFPVIDNTSLSVEQTAEEISKRIGGCDRRQEV